MFTTFIALVTAVWARQGNYHNVNTGTWLEYKSWADSFSKPTGFSDKDIVTLEEDENFISEIWFVNGIKLNIIWEC